MTSALIVTWTLFQGCLNLKLAADRQLFPSLSTISDYVPLVQVALLLSCIDFPINTHLLFPLRMIQIVALNR